MKLWGSFIYKWNTLRRLLKMTDIIWVYIFLYDLCPKLSRHLLQIYIKKNTNQSFPNYYFDKVTVLSWQHPNKTALYFTVENLKLPGNYIFTYWPRGMNPAVCQRCHHCLWPIYSAFLLTKATLRQKIFETLPPLGQFDGEHCVFLSM